MSDNHAADVQAFHDRFDVNHHDAPDFLHTDVFAFRLQFLHEELVEFVQAHVRLDIADTVDSLVDLIYVAYGTLLLMGLTADEINECWDEVQRANMTKIRAANAGESKRGHVLDVIKPEGWTPPNILTILQRIKTEGR